MKPSLQAQILPLSIPEKLQLIEEIWESLELNPEQIPVTQAQQQELERRLVAYETVEDRGESWDIVKQRILKNDV